MKFSEFKQYRPKQETNAVVFVCEDDFLVEESRPVWQAIFGADWVFEKYSAKEFEEIPAARLMDEAMTPSLFAQNRILIITHADKLTKGRVEALVELQNVKHSALRLILVASSRKGVETW